MLELLLISQDQMDKQGFCTYIWKGTGENEVEFYLQI